MGEDGVVSALMVRHLTVMVRARGTVMARTCRKVLGTHMEVTAAASTAESYCI
jgi:hypothetical protein